jgi:hypothetical protein
VIFQTAGTNVNLSAITGGSGDCGGNTIIGGGTLTFTAATTQTWQSTGSGNVSDVTKWTSRIPLPQDTCVFSSAFTGSPTITCDVAWMGSVDFSSSTGTVTFNSGTGLQNGGNIVGGFKGRNGLTVGNASGSTFYFNSRRSTDTFTFGGCSIGTGTFQFSCGNGGTLTFQDSGTLGAVEHRSGVLAIAAGKTVGMSTYLSNAISASAPCTVTGPGQWNLVGNGGTLFSMIGAASLTTISTPNIGITSTGSSSKTFAGNGGTYPQLAITGGGTGAIIITGANTFADLPQVVGGTKTITHPASTTTTYKRGEGFGNGTNVVTFNSSTGGTQATWAIQQGGSVDANYTSFQDTLVTLTGSGGSFYAGATSTNVSNNTGLTFSAAPRAPHAAFLTTA